MMLPDRINLFRAQAIRSMGGNAWRTAHNPPEPGLLDILGALPCTYTVTSSQTHSHLTAAAWYTGYILHRSGRGNGYGREQNFHSWNHASELHESVRPPRSEWCVKIAIVNCQLN
jgi:hypothetical protein